MRSLVLKACLAAMLAATVLPAAAGAVDLTPNPLDPPDTYVSPAEQEAQRLKRFSLTPLPQLAAAKRNIRRVSYAEIFNSPSAPAVTFERLADGQVEMTVVSEWGAKIDRAKLKPEAWAYLTEKDAFKLPKGKKAPANEICHGQSAVIEATEKGKSWRYDAAMCNGQGDLPALFYARRLAGVAVDSIPRCGLFREHAREESWTLIECLKRTRTPPRPQEINGHDKNRPGPYTNFAISTTSEMVGKLPDGGMDYY